jgi:hypothetical protein
MKGKLRTLGAELAALALMFGLSTSAWATIVSLGDPYPTDSWAWNFHNPESFQYNHVEGIMVSGTTFETLGFAPYSPSGWASTFVSSTHVAATGTATTDLYTIINFNDPTTAVWDFNVYNNAAAVASYRLFHGTQGGAYDAGGGWRYDILDASKAPPVTPVPEASTMIAGALLLLPFGARTMRMLRKRMA